MTRDSYAELTYMHHTARYFPDPDRWVIINRDCESVAVVATSTTSVECPKSIGRECTVTTVNITLVLGEYKIPLDPVMRPGSMRTQLRWVCQELNNGNFWLGARLFLEREARLLDYSEPELLACEHAYDYQYCLRLLANLPGLLESTKNTIV